MRTKNLRFIVWFASLFFACIAQAHASTAENLLRQKSNPFAGNPAGKVTIVEFFDYDCSYCGSMIPTIAAILRNNPQVRFVYKEYPIRGPESELASRAALAAKMQGKYQQFSHALFRMSSVNEKSISKLAKSLGLNAKKLISDMNSSTIAGELQRNYDLGNDLNVSGTPTFFIAKTNETRMNKVLPIYGEASRAALEAAINKVS